MRVRILIWAMRAILAPALAVMILSTAAQGNQGKMAMASPTVQTDPPAKAAQPLGHPDHSWVDNKTYVIGESDVLDINVWKEKEISRTTLVRSDGKISLPLIGEVRASGVTPLQLRDEIIQRLKAYIENPEVTVIVNEPRSHHFNIVGQVNRAGTYPLTETMTVLDGILSAGGFRDFAKQTKIYVLRPAAGGTLERIRFNYKRVVKGKSLQQNVVLKPGDTIVVP